MCKYCRKITCPSLCKAKGGKEEAYGGLRCRNCGTRLSGREPIYRSHGKPYCQNCIEDASTDDLVRFCETTWDEWLSGMGIEREDLPARTYVGGDYDV